MEGDGRRWLEMFGDGWTWLVMVLLQPLVSPHGPGGRLLFRFFLEPNSLTRENTLSLPGFSLAPLLLLGLLLPRPAFAFSRSRACRFWRIRELAMAAARDMLPAADWNKARRPGCVYGGAGVGGEAVGWGGRKRKGGLHHPRLSSHHTPAAAVSHPSVI